MMHRYWTIADPAARQMDMIMFMKNVSMLGAALMLTYFGGGPYSLDAARLGPAQPLRRALRGARGYPLSRSTLREGAVDIGLRGARDHLRPAVEHVGLVDPFHSGAKLGRHRAEARLVEQDERLARRLQALLETFSMPFCSPCL